MKFNEALDVVSKAYVPGVVGFYGKIKPDPWQEAHDRLESFVLMRDPEMLEVGTEAFVKECLDLISSYKRMNLRVKHITPADAFHIGDEQRLKEIMSAKDKQCYVCDSKQQLKIISSFTDELAAVIICEQCYRKKKK